MQELGAREMSQPYPCHADLSKTLDGTEDGTLIRLRSNERRARDRDLERQRSLEPMTEPLRLRRRVMLMLSNPMDAHFSS